MTELHRMTDLYEMLTSCLGYPGRMLSGVKEGPPGETVYWNACVFTEDDKAQVWYGDVNLDRDLDKIQAAANASGRVLLLTPENPFRFGGLDGKDRGFGRQRPEDRKRIRRFEPQG